MKNLRDLLRGADPLNHEGGWNVAQQGICLKAIVGAPEVAPRSHSVLFAAIVSLFLIAAIVMGSRAWTTDIVNAQAAVRFEVRLAEEHPAPGLREAGIGQSGKAIYLHQDAVVVNGDIRQAQVVQGATPSTFSITVMFSSDAAQRLLDVTKGHVGRPLAILIGGEVVLAPVLRGPIGTSATITGNFTKAEADRIAAGILGR